MEELKKAGGADTAAGVAAGETGKPTGAAADTSGRQSLKEERIRRIAFLYYSRQDIRKNMLEFSQHREVVPRYFEGFGKRPDTLQYESDILELAKKGATSFHCSEELWKDATELATGMTEEQLNSLRTGWDLLIDIDSKYLDYSKIAAELIIKALAYHGVKNIGIKFSGSKGFHLIVPWKAFPKEVHGKSAKNMFPEWPRLICSYLNDMIKKELVEKISDLTRKGMAQTSEYIRGAEKPGDFAEKVAPDIVLVSSRHLFRMPYSLHEKTSLASVVLDKNRVAEFDIKDADALKAKPTNFIPDSAEGEATELLLQALDHKPPEQEQRSAKFSAGGAGSSAQFPKENFDELILKDLSPELYPQSIKAILAGMKTDGRKRALFILLNFLRSLKIEPDRIEKTIGEWNLKNYKPLEQGYIKAQLSWHFKTQPKLPPNFDKPHYKEIGITPTEEELRTKNPVSYVARKSFRLNRTMDRTNKPR